MKKLICMIAYVALITTVCHAGNIKKANIEPEKGQVWWGYFSDDGNYGDIGVNAQQHYSCAIKIAHDNKVAAGKTIHAVRMWFNNKITSANLENLRVWISDTLPNRASDASICCESVNYRKGGVVDGAFSTPYTMADKDVYVGFSYTIYDLGTDATTQTACGYPILTTTGLPDIPNALFIKYWGSKPQDHSWYSNQDDDMVGAGNLAMNVLLGDDIYSNALAISASDLEVAVKGSTASVPVTVENVGSTPVTGFDYTVTIDGKSGAEQHVDLVESPINDYRATKSLSVSVPASSNVGKGTFQLKVTKVNDTANEALAAEGTATASLLTVAQESKRKTYIENYVKCTDGFSVFAYVSDDSLRAMHNDYLGVVIHDQDAMQTNLMETTCYTLPSNWFYAHINRHGNASDVYAYYGSQYNDAVSRRTKFGIEDDFQAAQAEKSEAGLSLKAEWTDEGKTDVQVTTDVTFQFDSNAGGYALGYVLCEDQMSGTGESWEQTNNVLPQLKESHIFDWDPVMTSKYVNGPTTITDMKYNNVLVAGIGMQSGVSGSLPSTFRQGQPVSHTFTFNLDEEAKISVQDKGKLTLTAMLFNTATGRIVNAERVSISDGTVGIKELQEVRSTSELYNLAGQKIAAPRKGVVIQNRRKVMINE